MAIFITIVLSMAAGAVVYCIPFNPLWVKFVAQAMRGLMVGTIVAIVQRLRELE